MMEQTCLNVSSANPRTLDIAKTFISSQRNRPARIRRAIKNVFPFWRLIMMAFVFRRQLFSLSIERKSWAMYSCHGKSGTPHLAANSMNSWPLDLPFNRMDITRGFVMPTSFFVPALIGIISPIIGHAWLQAAHQTGHLERLWWSHERDCPKRLRG